LGDALTDTLHDALAHRVRQALAYDALGHALANLMDEPLSDRVILADTSTDSGRETIAKLLPQSVAKLLDELLAQAVLDLLANVLDDPFDVLAPSICLEQRVPDAGASCFAYGLFEALMQHLSEARSHLVLDACLDRVGNPLRHPART